ncbi:hypothetical protein [Halobaculum rubrum]|uniref:hypothetical protein n=1 Tax=Halobaculum rubrum TaxID=2872158 RepID=UPI001CA3B597|nr:hypothetical protein [Halobaculum rubrum]QZX98732.1 hypothetical protein K6T25_10650 [Halobaculum rubrum]
MKRALLAALLVVSLVVPLVAVGGAVADGHGAAANESDTDSEANTYEELKRGGTTYESAPSSMRFLGDYSSATVRVFPVGPGESGWHYLERDEVVNGNQVQLRTVRLAPEDELDRTLNVTVVAWQKSTRTVERGNTTVEETVATNVSTYRHQIEAGRGYDTANVSLPAHYDETYQITMWVEGSDARWRFAHKSVETTRALPFAPTWGGYWEFTATNVLIWIVGLTGVTVVSAVGSIERTGKGPGLGLVTWAIIIAIGSAVIGLGAFVWTASLLSAAPPVIGFAIAAVIGIVVLETTEKGVYSVALMRLFTGEKSNPRGDLALEARDADFETVTLANTDSGTKVIETGIRPWLARLRTGGTEFVGIDRLNFEFDLGTPEVSFTDTVADKLIFVDEDGVNGDGDLATVSPSTVEWDLPIRIETEDGVRTNWTALFSLAFHMVVPFALASFTMDYLGVGGGRIVGALFAAVVVYAAHTRVTEGRAEFMPAVGMTEDAVATAMHMESEVDDYETLEQALDALVDERNSTDELIETLRNLDSEAAVRDASRRDTNPGSFVEGTDPTAEADD